jgi:photosystem II stability/assembly factor-like uncharacterized protein
MKTARYASTVSALLLIALAAGAPAQENVWTSHGPGSVGWINDLVILDDGAYAATLNGVFRSTDSGTTWQATGLSGKSVFQISGRPGAAAVFALASGVFPSPNLYVSRDSGQTWASVPGQDSAAVVGIDPERLSTVYAGSANDGSIWKSTDAGANWQQVSTLPENGRPLALALSSSAMYVLTFENLYKSADGGLTWSSVLPPGTAINSITSIAVGSTAGVVYAAGANGTGFCRSADSGATWTCSANFPNAGSVSRILEVPADGTAIPRLLGATSIGILLSQDVGATWATLPGDLASAYSTALASDASGSLVLAGTDTQALRSLDRGDTWTPAPTGLNAVWVGALALDPKDPSTVWAGGIGYGESGPGLFQSINAGLSWSPAGGSEGPRSVTNIAIDPAHPGTLYAGSSALFRTQDGGQTWTSSVPDPRGYLSGALAVDPAAPQRVLASTNFGLFRSEDGAETWRPTSIAQTVYSLLYDDRHPGTVYAASFWEFDSDYGYGTLGGSIFVSRDHGATFTKGAYEFPDAVLSIARDPFQDETLYAGTEAAGVFRSEDAGATWEGASEGLPSPEPGGFILYSPVFQLVADPVRPGYLYGATQGGVFRTTDGARTWQAFSDGLAPQATEALVVSPDGRRLYAGTIGGGVFELDLEVRVASSPCSPSPSRLCLVGGRYAVDLIATLPGSSAWTPGAARPLGDRSGYFGLPFATNDPDLPEVVVKMLAEGELGSAAAPVFYSSLTTLPYYLTVTDTLTGERRSYASTPGSPLCGGVDIPTEASGTSASPRAAPKAGAAALSLLGGRFSVALDAHRPGSNAVVHGAVIASGDQFGFFSLPEVTGDFQFPEIVVKMLDGRPVNGNFWFFQTGLTSLDYTLTVTDSTTGAVRTYGSGVPFCGGVDTRAFPNPVPGSESQARGVDGGISIRKEKS